MWLFYAIFGVRMLGCVVVATSGSLPTTTTASIEIVTKQGSSVYSEKLQGKFASIGSLDKAQGHVVQIHPFGLCNISNTDAFHKDEWVGIIKLTIQESPACNGTVQKVLGAVKKGAKAVIFDISESPIAARELNTQESIVTQPVIIMSGGSARKMMQIVSRQKVLKAKISWQGEDIQPKNSSSEYVDMVIFMTCFILITVTCFVLLLQIKWKQTKKESSLAKMAFDAVSKMESKKYAEERSSVETVKTMKEKRTLSIHSCSVAGFSCVICLEEFKDGQEIRIVSCGHEFHLKCVDPWLLTNYTCPLCMLNIVEREGKGIKTESRCSSTFRHLFRCCFTSSALSSSSMVYNVTLDETSNDGVSSSTNDTVESLHFYPVLTSSSSHALWLEHSETNEESEDGQRATSLHLPCPLSKQLKDTSQLSLHSLQSYHVGISLPNRQIMQERKAIQVSDRAIGKYSDLGDAV